MMTLSLDRNGAAPIYLQLKEWMRHQILTGAWPAGFKLRAEADLAEDLDLARGTVRRAIEELTAEGMLTRTHGRGTYVTPEPVEQPLAERLMTYSEALIAQGIAFRSLVLDQKLLPAPPSVAAAMGVSPGEPLFFLRRIRTVDDVPLLLLHNYTLHALCPGIERMDFTQYRLFEVLEGTFDLRLAWGRRTFQAQVADETTARLLDMDPGDSLMHLSQTTYLQDERAVEYSDVWLRGNRFRLSARVHRGLLGQMDIQVVGATA